MNSRMAAPSGVHGNEALSLKIIKITNDWLARLLPLHRSSASHSACGLFAGRLFPDGRGECSLSSDSSTAIGWNFFPVVLYLPYGVVPLLVLQKPGSEDAQQDSIASTEYSVLCICSCIADRNQESFLMFVGMCALWSGLRWCWCWCCVCHLHPTTQSRTQIQFRRQEIGLDKSS